MLFERCTISLIIPFQFDKNCYDLIGSETNSSFQNYFTEIELHPNLTQVGKNRFINPDSRLIKCFKLGGSGGKGDKENKENKWRTMIGLAQNKNSKYRFTRDELNFNFTIDDIHIWFWKFGKAFFTIKFTAEDLTEDQVLDFKRFLIDIKNRNREIKYTKKLSKTEEVTKSFTIKSMIKSKNEEPTDLFTLIKDFHPDTISATFENAYNITYCVAKPLLPDSLPIFLECLQGKKISDENHYIHKHKEHIIHWAFFKKSIVMTGDCENKFILGKNTGLSYSVSYNYMMLYQYYLCLYMECSEAKAYIESLNEDIVKCDKQKMERWKKMFKKPFEELSEEEHINTIFREYLCKNVWKLQKSIKGVKKTLANYDYGTENMSDDKPSVVFTSSKISDSNYQQKKRLKLPDDLSKEMEPKESLEKIICCDRNSPYIFISYSSNDRQLVWQDVVIFQSLGYRIWLDEKNLDKTKESWKKDALDAISDMYCKLLVFYVSSSSLTSQNCLEELQQTIAEETLNKHVREPVKFIAVDVENIENIIGYSHKIQEDIMENNETKKIKDAKIQVLSRIIGNFFSNNNERVRIHPKNEIGRTSDYYQDIIKCFPDKAKIYQ